MRRKTRGPEMRDAPLTIRLKRGRDARDVLECIRADGTRTWTRVQPFFPTHDLTHYAVESVLGIGDAFFGLVAAGWDIDDFAAPGAASRIPPVAVWVEIAVGTLQPSRDEPAEEINARIDAAARGIGVAFARTLSQAEVDAVRRLRDDACARWAAVPPGGDMTLPFPADATLSPG